MKDDNTVHIRRHGHNIDRRFRRTMVAVHRVSHGGNFCGAPESAVDVSRENAVGLVRMLPFASFPNAQRAVEAAKRLCKTCLDAANITVPKD